MSGQVHETEWSNPRPHGAMMGKPQCQRSRASLCAPGVAGELSPAFSTQARVTQPAPWLGRGTDGVTGTFSARMLGMEGRGELLMPGMGRGNVEALSAMSMPSWRDGVYRRSLSAKLGMGEGNC